MARGEVDEGLEGVGGLGCFVFDRSNVYCVMHESDTECCNNPCPCPTIV